MGYIGGPARAPLGPLSAEAQRQIKEQLAQIEQTTDSGAKRGPKGAALHD
jgi:hypothetical protein